MFIVILTTVKDSGRTFTEKGGKLTIEDVRQKRLRCAYDIDAITTDEEGANGNVNRLNEYSGNFEMEINLYIKTITMGGKRTLEVKLDG